jgi:hypothetical protein
MSVSVSLQDLVLALLKGAQAVSDMVDDRIIDGPDEDTAFPFISFGPDDAVRDDAECIPGRRQTMQLDCWSRDQGKLWPCKRLVDAVVGALHEAEGDLSVGALVSLRVALAQTFLDSDGKTAHGVVQVTATVEEPVE